MKIIDSSCPDFESMIDCGYLYVDKTAYLGKLIQANKRGVYFFSRPRRFGKSLTVSTLESIFKGRREKFKGLAIYNDDAIWKERRPVIRLDMSERDKSSPQALEFSLMKAVKDLCKKHQVDIEVEKQRCPKEAFCDLIRVLAQRTVDDKIETKGIALLIDEYDFPILENIDSPDANGILAVLKDFYLAIKICYTDLRFVFITGISKFSHATIFSGLNMLKDISMHPDYATMLGYTQEELETSFSKYIDVACRCENVKLTRQELLEKIKFWYDGYRFENEAPRVYNPMSVACFLTDPKHDFLNYWYTSGTPTFLLGYAQKKKTVLLEELSRPVDQADFGAAEVYKMNTCAVMFQCGYLTIKETFNEEGKRKYRLDFPNWEVRESFSKFLLADVSGKEERDIGSMVDVMRHALLNSDLEKFMIEWQGLLAACDHRMHIPSEAVFQYNAQFLFRLCRFESHDEEATNQGTIDNVFSPNPTTTYIFEFKYNKTAKFALEQINTKKYYQKFLSKGKRVILVGVNYSSKERQIDAWMATELTERGKFVRMILPTEAGASLEELNKVGKQQVAKRRRCTKTPDKAS